jgi:hypothetical protein
VYCVCFPELHLGGSNFKFLRHLLFQSFPLGNIEELFHHFENLLEGLRSDAKLPAELLLIQYAIENLNPLQVRLHIVHTIHQVTSELNAPWQLDLTTVGLNDPELHPELCITNWGSLIDLSMLAILIS